MLHTVGVGDVIPLFNEIQVNLGADFATPLEVAAIPVDFPGMNPPLRVILDLLVDSNGGIEFPLNPTD